MAAGQSRGPQSPCERGAQQRGRRAGRGGRCRPAPGPTGRPGGAGRAGRPPASPPARPRARAAPRPPCAPWPGGLRRSRPGHNAVDCAQCGAHVKMGLPTVRVLMIQRRRPGRENEGKAVQATEVERMCHSQHDCQAGAGQELCPAVRLQSVRTERVGTFSGRHVRARARRQAGAPPRHPWPRGHWRPSRAWRPPPSAPAARPSCRTATRCIGHRAAACTTRQVQHGGSANRPVIEGAQACQGAYGGIGPGRAQGALSHFLLVLALSALDEEVLLLHLQEGLLIGLEQQNSRLTAYIDAGQAGLCIKMGTLLPPCQAGRAVFLATSAPEAYDGWLSVSTVLPSPMLAYPTGKQTRGWALILARQGELSAGRVQEL